VINLWRWKFVTADDTAVFVNSQHVFSDEDKILIKSLYLKRYTAERLTEEFPEKIRTKHGVNKCRSKQTRTRCSQPALRRAVKLYPTTTSSFQSHILPRIITIPSYAECAKYSIDINTLSMHSYTYKGIKICALKMQFVCFFPYLMNICRIFEFLVSPGSVATCLRWGE